MEGKVLPYKLAWVDETNSNFLNSIMFEKDDEAKKYAKDEKLSTYLLFKLETNNDGNYSWELLPEGSYYSYMFGIKAKNIVSKFGIPMLFFGGLILTGIYLAKKNP